MSQEESILRGLIEAEQATDEVVKCDETLAYTYTDHIGLVGMLRDKKPRASHAFLLNDPSEESVPLDALNRALEQLYEDEDGKNYRVVFEEIRRQTYRSDYYVWCLSRARDTLSMWRGYGRGGAGYCVGIDLTRVRAALPSLTTLRSARLSTVCYAAEEQMLSVLRRVHEKLDLRGRGVNPATASDFASKFLKAVAPLMTATKDGAYKDEQEIRLVVEAAASLLKFRAPGGHLVPYVEVDLSSVGTFPVVEVVIGPTHNPDRSEAAVRLLLESVGLPSVSVSRSKVPFAG